MSAYLQNLKRSLICLAVLGATGVRTSVETQSVTLEETTRSVRRMLERLPYYGVFDYIVFRVEGGTVYLAGAETTPQDVSDWQHVQACLS